MSQFQFVVFARLHQAPGLVICQGIERDGADLDGLLNEAIEELAPRGGLSSVESKGEFVEVVV